MEEKEALKIIEEFSKRFKWLKDCNGLSLREIESIVREEENSDFFIRVYYSPKFDKYYVELICIKEEEDLGIMKI
jgi:hypothetical protein